MANLRARRPAGATSRRRRVPWRRLGRAAASAVVLGLPVAALAVLVRLEYGPVLAADESAIRRGTDLTRSSPGLHGLLVVWQTAFQAASANLVALAVCAWVWRRHGLRGRALWAVTTILVSWALALAAKYLVQRARPVVEEAVAVAPGFSFPSGHVANTTTAVGALTVLVWPVLRGRGRVAVCLVGVTLVLATAANRVLLGVHYPSDALAGIAFGAAVVAGSYLGYAGPGDGAPPADDDRGP